MHRRQNADCEDGESEEGGSFAPSFFGSLLGNIFGIFLLVLANVIFWGSIVVGGVIGYTLWGSFGAVMTAAGARKSWVRKSHPLRFLHPHSQRSDVGASKPLSSLATTRALVVAIAPAITAGPITRRAMKIPKYFRPQQTRRVGMLLYPNAGPIPLQDGTQFRKDIVTLIPENPNRSGVSELNRWHTNQY